MRPVEVQEIHFIVFQVTGFRVVHLAGLANVPESSFAALAGA